VAFEAKINERFGAFEAQLDHRFRAVDAGMREALAHTKGESLRWKVGLWLVQLAAVAAIVKLLLK
jgi:hypothetical protein